jgi:hypothetical protein
MGSLFLRHVDDCDFTAAHTEKGFEHTLEVVFVAIPFAALSEDAAIQEHRLPATWCGTAKCLRRVNYDINCCHVALSFPYQHGVILPKRLGYCQAKKRKKSNKTAGLRGFVVAVKLLFSIRGEQLCFRAMRAETSSECEARSVVGCALPPAVAAGKDRSEQRREVAVAVKIGAQLGCA